MCFEQKLIEQCAPTLANIKTGNLFTYKYDCAQNADLEIKQWQKKLAFKGISITILRKDDQQALIYVYRLDALRKDLGNRQALGILKHYGYAHNKVRIGHYLARLKTRMISYDEFPHEIGLFLGYPPTDVWGFICQKGRNCNLCGYWKVYGNSEQAAQKFAQYDACRELYKRLWLEGENLWQLTVA